MVAPEIVTIHWEGKQLPTLKNTATEERLAVLLGCNTSTKLLGVARYPPSSNQKAGKVISERTIENLSKWGSALNQLSICVLTRQRLTLATSQQPA